MQLCYSSATVCDINRGVLADIAIRCTSLSAGALHCLLWFGAMVGAEIKA
jgi:hypothetical protein